MIDRLHELPLARQAAVLGLSRGSLYYEPRPVSVADLAIMRRIDELHLDYPFAGSRMLRDLLRGEGIGVGREQVTTMMRRMGIEALYRRPNTSKPADGHKIYPYLLRGLAVERANQVWAMDITYIPMARGFVSPLGRMIEKSSDQKGETCMRITKGATECVVRPVPLGVVTVRRAGGVRDQHKERFRDLVAFRPHGHVTCEGHGLLGHVLVMLRMRDHYSVCIARMRCSASTEPTI